LLAAAAAPEQVVGFPYADAGLDYYSNGIVAADETIKTNPDLIRRFVKATLHGLATAIADPQQAGPIMHKYHPEIDTSIAIGETEKVKELALQRKLGAMEPVRVDKTIAVVAATYPLKKNLISTDVYAPGFLPN
jgi:NitT/TauT family transport system substrate-binding protein